MKSANAMRAAVDWARSAAARFIFVEEDDEGEDGDGEASGGEGTSVEDQHVGLEALQEAEIMEQLQELHQQLAVRRHANKLAAEQSAREREALLSAPRKLLVCSVHKPVYLEKLHGMDAYTYRESYGGLKAGVDALERSGVLVRWVSWPGTCPKASQEGVRKKLDETYNCRPVFIDDRELEEMFFVRFCHGILWPLFHCIPSPGLSDAAGIGSRAARPDAGPESVLGKNVNGGRRKLSMRSAADQLDAYTRVNQLFLEAVAEEYREGDLVVVYDYQLMLLPAMLRKRFPEVACAFFLHCPFPSSEFYRMLPAREQLLRGTLGADLVSFNHFDYVRHFLNACMRVLGLETSKSRLEFGGRLVSVSICPAGINPDEFEDDNDDASERDEDEDTEHPTLAHEDPSATTQLPPNEPMPPPQLESSPPQQQQPLSSISTAAILANEGVDAEVPQQQIAKPESAAAIAARLRGGLLANRKVIVSIASLDMSKGIPQTLLAMESMLASKPEWRGVAMLVLAVRDRGRPYDAQLRKAVDGLVGHVIGRFGCADYCPVLYIKRDLTREEMAALYTIADAVLVASVREGLNLGAMEFIACQSTWLERKLAQERAFYAEDLGVLVYSEFAGCASSLEDGALLVNPYDTDGVARALDAALTMPKTNKQVRHHKLSRYVNTYTAELWATRLVRELRLAKDKASEYNRVLPLDVGRLRSFYDRSSRRLLIFEHGALSPNTDHPLPVQLAPDHPTFVACLQALCQDQRNAVYVLSGRKREKLKDLWPSELFDNLGLVAEFGYYLKQPTVQDEQPAADWQRVVPNIDLSWKSEVVPILEDFTRQTPGSYLEINQTCLVWHFRDSDKDFGPSQAKDLQLHLDVILQNRPVRIVTAPSKKRVVIQPSTVSKGRALRAAVKNDGFDAYDLVFAVGDERNDDDIFEAIESSSSHSFTCTVGRKLSRATYSLDDDELIPTLQSLAAVSTDPNRVAKVVSRPSTTSVSESMESAPLVSASSARPQQQRSPLGSAASYTVDYPAPLRDSQANSLPNQPPPPPGIKSQIADDGTAAVGDDPGDSSADSPLEKQAPGTSTVQTLDDIRLAT